MQLVVWNSQGKKWDAFWTNYINPLATAIRPQDVMGLLVESGWAPWVTPGTVKINTLYPLTREQQWYSIVGARRSVFCQGVLAKRKRYAMWVPWVANLNAFKTNTRCSMGGVLVSATRNLRTYRSIEFPHHKRPVIRMEIARVDDVQFTVFLVHLISGYPSRAQNELNELADTISASVPEGTPAIVLGDMNIDLLKVNLEVPDKWRIISTGVPTQKRGGELDWALLYDPLGSLRAATATVVQQYVLNGSDHSVLRYDIPLR